MRVKRQVVGGFQSVLKSITRSRAGCTLKAGIHVQEGGTNLGCLRRMLGIVLRRLVVYRRDILSGTSVSTSVHTASQVNCKSAYLLIVPCSVAHGQHTVLDGTGPKMMQNDVARHREDAGVVREGPLLHRQ